MDELRLGLDKSLVKIEGDGRHDAALLRALQGMVHIRQVLELGARRDLLAVVLTRDRVERDSVRARIAELTARPVFWDEILAETHAPARLTWAALAKRIAGEQEALSEALDDSSSRGQR